MSLQTLQRISFSNSLDGDPISVDSYTSLSPEAIHDSWGMPSTKQQAVHMYAHNASAGQVLLHVQWNPFGTGTLMTAATMSYLLDPYQTRSVMAPGHMLGQTHIDPAEELYGGITAYVGSSGDISKVKIFGFALIVDQPTSVTW